mmetsp:Transcript_57163/g.134546  ORF Transcript_57163/g.134546 Transcript_57163/m.134546 type:complete len:247 (+) Transcript_57163:1618-2358(+)
MALLQLRARCCRIGCRTNQGNDRIELIEGQQQAQEDVVALFRLAQQIARAAFDRLNSELEEHLEHLAQREQNRLTVDQRQHVGAEIALKWGELVEIVKHHLRISIAAQLHNNAHAIAITLIANIGNTFQLLVVDHLSDAFNHRRLIRLVRQSCNHHRITIRATRRLDRFDTSNPSHRHRAAPGEVSLTNSAATKNLSARGEVRSRDKSHQLLIRDLRITDQGQQTRDQLSKVVRRNVGGHAHRNPC